LRLTISNGQTLPVELEMEVPIGSMKGAGYWVLVTGHWLQSSSPFVHKLKIMYGLKLTHLEPRTKHPEPCFKLELLNFELFALRPLLLALFYYL